MTVLVSCLFQHYTRSKTEWTEICFFIAYFILKTLVNCCFVNVLTILHYLMAIVIEGLEKLSLLSQCHFEQLCSAVRIIKNAQECIRYDQNFQNLLRFILDHPLLEELPLSNPPPQTTSGALFLRSSGATV